MMKHANFEEKKNFTLYKEKMLTDKVTIKSGIRRWAQSALKA